jgi:hypothetical protein
MKDAETEEFVFKVPYNETWKWSSHGSIAEVAEVDGILQFGYPRIIFDFMHGCAYNRDFTYALVPSRTAEEAKAFYEKQYSVDPKNVRIGKIGDNTVVTMTNVEGVCPAPTMEVIGTTHNHIFSTSCDANSSFKDPRAELEKIVRTVKLK